MFLYRLFMIWLCQIPPSQEYNFITVYYKTIIHTRHNFVYGADHKQGKLRLWRRGWHGKSYAQPGDCFYYWRKWKLGEAKFCIFCVVCCWVDICGMSIKCESWKLSSHPQLYSVRLICSKNGKFIKEMFSIVPFHIFSFVFINRTQPFLTSNIYIKSSNALYTALHSSIIIDKKWSSIENLNFLWWKRKSVYYGRLKICQQCPTSTTAPHFQLY